MESFWQGFEKRAEDVMTDWEENSQEEDKKQRAKSKKGMNVDPLTLSQGYTPDTYWRSWP